MIQKNLYTSPEVDVVELQPEGVVCTSLGGSSIAPGTPDNWGTL